MPLVSGITFQTQTNCSSIIAPKKAKTHPPTCAAKTGKAQVIAAAMTQWVVLPRAWPLPRTALGKTSEMKTQITAPWEMAKAAMKPSSPTSTSVPFGWALSSCRPTRIRASAVATEPK